MVDEGADEHRVQVEGSMMILMIQRMVLNSWERLNNGESRHTFSVPSVLEKSDQTPKASLQINQDGWVKMKASANDSVKIFNLYRNRTPENDVPNDVSELERQHQWDIDYQYGRTATQAEWDTEYDEMF
ncbi:hypothetical protein ACMFMG_010237 [Clarireedia jacksonii]